MSSAFMWTRLFGVLDGIKGSTNVEVFRLKKTSQPATFISEAHRQHTSQRFHQMGVCFCGVWGAEVSSDITQLIQSDQQEEVFLPWGRWGYRAASLNPVEPFSSDGRSSWPDGGPWPWFSSLGCRDCSSPVDGSTSLGLRWVHSSSESLKLYGTHLGSGPFSTDHSGLLVIMLTIHLPNQHASKQLVLSDVSGINTTVLFLQKEVNDKNMH